jgi:folate-binding Fe-S cluster repair protein YgfZ
MDMVATTLMDRAVVRLLGEDVHGFLQGLVTSDVMGTLPVWAALLTPQGKCLFDFMIWEDGDDLLIDCEAATADDLIKRITSAAQRSGDDSIVSAVAAKLAGEVRKRSRPRWPGTGRRSAICPQMAGQSYRLRLSVCEAEPARRSLWLECSRPS